MIVGKLSPTNALQASSPVRPTRADSQLARCIEMGTFVGLHTVLGEHILPVCSLAAHSSWVVHSQAVHTAVAERLSGAGAGREVEEGGKERSRIPHGLRLLVGRGAAGRSLSSTPLRD